MTTEPESPRSAAGEPATSSGRAWVVVAVMLVAAFVVLVPGLGNAGLWTVGELPILDRALAALGEPRAELIRSPWLPDQLRLWSFVTFGQTDAALRLPGALAGVGLVGLTLVMARRLGWSPVFVALAGCFALALPLVSGASRTVLGNPVGELAVAGATLASIHALERAPARKLVVRALAGIAALACLAGAVASLGIVLGGCLPLVLVALTDVARGPRQGGLELPRAAIYAAWAGAAVAGFVGLWLAWHQGEGYIPLLGAAKDLELLEDPRRAGFTDPLERVGYQLFPVTGLVVLGLLGPGRARWPALWFGVAVVIVSAWSLIYGPTPCPVAVPAALLATAACERLVDPDEPIAARRMVLFCAVLAALVLAKDGGRTPQHVASPLFDVPVIEFPPSDVVAGFDLSAALPSLAKRFAALLWLAHMIAPPSRGQRRERARRVERQSSADGSASLRPWFWRPWSALLDALARAEVGLDRRLERADATRRIAAVVVVLAALAQLAWGYGRQNVDALGQQLSIAEPMRRFEAAVTRGEIPNDQLALHRVRDPGVRRYGPGPERELFLANRGELSTYLSDVEPRAAMIRRADFPAVFKAARKQERPLHVLDAAHHEYLLVANFLPEGVADQSPVLDIVYDEPVTLANPTFIAWDPYLELHAWEIEGELHRGARATMHLVFRVRRSLPAGTKLYARLQRGKSSRVAAAPQELTGGVLPPNYWQAGDYIHHRLEFEVPWLEVLPGEHELIVGLRRSEKTNLKISAPTPDKPGPHVVKLFGKKQEFAVIGTVELAW